MFAPDRARTAHPPDRVPPGRAAHQRRAKRGFTLFEVTIAAALMVLAGTVAVSVLVPSLRSTAGIQERVSMQQRSLVAIRRIADDLQDTTPAAVSILPSPAVMAGQPVKEISPEGRRLFQTRLWAYAVVGHELRRMVWVAPGPPSMSADLQAEKPTRLGPDDLANFTTDSFPEALTLTDQVSSVTFAHHGVGTAVAGPIEIDILLKGTGNDPAQVRMRRLISPRLGE